VDLEGEGIYKGHRLHVTMLPNSGAWVALAYRLGSTDSGVRRIRGEYPTRAEAVAAAKTQIDREEEETRG
jgi:hypothetical protein